MVYKKNSFQGKIFIIGLPRTATSSVCLAMLKLGFKTAHTAYTQNTFEQAQVIGDAPVFCDYQLLDKKYPNSKFIYLTRDPNLWVPSIKQLLQRMFVNLDRTDGGSNPIMRRCFKTTFSPFLLENILQDSFLLSCYLKHKKQVEQYFIHRQDDFLAIDVSDKYSHQRLRKFLTLESTSAKGFDKINVGRKVTAWLGVKHPLKIESTNKGRIDKHIY